MMMRDATRMRENVVAISRDLQKYRWHADFFDVEQRASHIDAAKKNKNIVRVSVLREPILRARTTQK
jgi:hypothetical protein